jgi:hypothetical protein
MGKKRNHPPGQPARAGRGLRLDGGAASTLATRCLTGCGMSYSSDLTDEQWALLEPVVQTHRASRGPVTHTGPAASQALLGSGRSQSDLVDCPCVERAILLGPSEARISAITQPPMVTASWSGWCVSVDWKGCFFAYRSLSHADLDMTVVCGFPEAHPTGKGTHPESDSVEYRCVMTERQAQSSKRQARRMDSRPNLD